MVQESEPKHDPVLLARVVELLRPALAGTAAAAAPILVDCTLGLGGHAAGLLESCPSARLIGLDRDPQALAVARRRLARFGDRVHLRAAVYHDLAEVLEELGLAATGTVAAILLDLGLSSLQIDSLERGFSYARDAPLDMRMGAGVAGLRGPTAADILNSYDVARLVEILRRHADERFAPRIARSIAAEREITPFTTSGRLVEVITSAVPAAARHTGGHPAKRTFQALRIEVNQELESLAAAVPVALDSLGVGGRIAVLSYHSGEDRLIKQAFTRGAADSAPRNLPVVPESHAPELQLLTRGAERPSAAEISRNPRAASARLRAAVRIRAPRTGGGK